MTTVSIKSIKYQTAEKYFMTKVKMNPKSIQRENWMTVSKRLVN
jgi:hypothetical protein